jgi:hypothetical protein
MFVAEKIRECANGLVGIRQPFDASYAIFSGSVLQSRYGEWLDSIPLYKSEYFIDAVCPANTTNEEKNTILQRMIQDAFVTVCNRVFTHGSLVDRQVQYPGANNLTQLQQGLLNGFVGVRFLPSAKKNIAFRLNRLFLNVQGEGNLTLRLFNSNSDASVQTKVIEVLPNQKTYDILLNWECNNTLFYKGEWFVGYTFDGQITPYARVYKGSNVGNTIRDLFWENIIVPNHTSGDLFNLDNYASLGGLSTGLNFDISTYEDVTDFIIANDHLFAYATKLELAIQVFQSIRSSNRSNINERYAKGLSSELLAAIKGLKGQGLAEVGLENLLLTEVTRIRAEIEKLKLDAGTSLKIYVCSRR